MAGKAKESHPDTYRALVGLSYPNPDGEGELRVEEGTVVHNLPERSVGSLLSHHYIEKVEG